ncbi:MAG: 2,3-bisphosphoglycerate-independent phosphoglycerate mutase [Candidatus Omnitrophica bacterium]|nr:2,3-bisphosphoglycerate-independent phosphoglycerate mutase [Candidatus Omnitrophota bacterium]MDE2222514.1 2,3-bisphosphoglycerate-independent phosphoglycerate mutase [Candidatus Omnitrophota bacterium]
MSLELKKLSNFSGRPGPLLLVIMDGVGIGKHDDSDGVFLAKTPTLDTLMKSKLYTQLKAHGTAVGMPSDEDMGNSEVGHNALGAGRVFDQGAKLAAKSISSGAIYQTEIWKKLVERVKSENKVFHFIGLLSDGNVHSHIDQLLAMVRHLAQEGVRRVCIHVLLDGRDVYEKSALTYIDKTEAVLKEINSAHKNYEYRIASGGGRMVTTMDRYNADWTIVERGWKAHVLGRARRFASAKEAVETYYKEDPKITDQYLDSFVIEDDGSPVGTIEDGDSVVFFNFRGDRAIELSRAFEERDFDKFNRVRTPDVLFAGMMEYDGDLHIPKHYLVPPPAIDNPVGVYMCANGITSFAISETQKYGHVTYFWNGNRSGYINEKLETYVEIPSDKIRFDQAPRMKADEITAKTVELLQSGKYKFGRLNYPNGDMVGHTGVPEAIIASVEAVDEDLAKLLSVIKELNGVALVLADHGNADEMFTVKNGKKQVSTAHSLNPVPCIIVDAGYQDEYEMAHLPGQGLANVAATLLNLLGYEAPKDYAPSLIRFKS